MSYALGEHFEKFIRDQVQAGRYRDESEVLREGLRLIEERDAKRIALKEHVLRAIERGGAHSDADIEAALLADSES
ncbi:MAG: type II toxin-antitoxin system ParD family antitoxin [Candidatus Hydrogenedens sp.]|nr:type II toxin-antitoxin system ParD family antitoxin [Candidatus Hydrogenedens sp.]